MGVKQKIIKLFSNEKKILDLRIQSIEKVFISFTLFFFLNFFFVGARFYFDIFIVLLPFTYMIFILSGLLYIFLLIIKKLKDKSKVYLYISGFILFIFFIIFLLPVLMTREGLLNIINNLL